MLLALVVVGWMIVILLIPFRLHDICCPKVTSLTVRFCSESCFDQSGLLNASLPKFRNVQGSELTDTEFKARIYVDHLTSTFLAAFLGQSRSQLVRQYLEGLRYPPMMSEN